MSSILLAGLGAMLSEIVVSWLAFLSENIPAGNIHLRGPFVLCLLFAVAQVAHRLELLLLEQTGYLLLLLH